MIRKIFYLFCLSVFIFPTYAEQIKDRRVIPHIEQVSPSYLSTSLLLDPCLDINSLEDSVSDDVIRQVEEAKKVYPPNTCNNPVLVEKLFKTRFLQSAVITLVNAPWILDKEIVKQDEVISQCKDIACLDKALDAIINRLSPLYLNPPSLPSGKELCSGSVDFFTDDKMALVIEDLVGSLSTDDTCGNYGTAADEHNPRYDDKGKQIPYADVRFVVCKADNGNLFIAECQMAGNQVNTQTWIYLLQQASKTKLLFNSDNGPFYTLSTTCNGMPDLMTNARYNMAEHEIVYYRYNGQQYEAAYSYMSDYVGNDDNGNGMSVAQHISKKEINCQVANE